MDGPRTIPKLKNVKANDKRIPSLLKSLVKLDTMAPGNPISGPEMKPKMTAIAIIAPSLFATIQQNKTTSPPISQGIKTFRGPTYVATYAGRIRPKNDPALITAVM